MEQLLTYLADMGVTTTHLLAIAVGLGVFAVVFGLASATNTAQTPQQRRMRAVSAPASENAILTLDDNDPKGALKLFIPLSGQERSKIARMLRQAGIHRPRAVREFFLVRSLLSVTLPAVFLLAAWTGSRLPAPLNDALRPLLDLTNLQVLQIGVGLAALGFLAPFVWLRRKVSARKMAIWRGLPNALDLLRVSVEAGLGFDAAVLRVARELKDVAPAIAEEFTVLLLEIRAGKSRERAFNDLGARTGVEEISAFSSVVLQSAESTGVLADFHLEVTAPFFGRSRGLSYWLWPGSATRRRIETELSLLDRYLTDSQRQVAKQLALAVRERDDLDFHQAVQGRLKLWLFAHIAMTYSLWALIVIHVILVHAFRGA